MARVCRSLVLIQKDLAEVKKDLKKTIKEDNLKSLHLTITRKILDQYNRVEKRKQLDVFKKWRTTIKKIEKLQKNVEKLEQSGNTHRGTHY
jgi:regulator of replication initiation timing